MLGVVQINFKKMEKSKYESKERAFNNHLKKQKEKYFGNSEKKFTMVDKLNFNEAWFRLKNKLNDKNIYVPNMDNVNFGNPQSLKHFIAKSVLGYFLIVNKQHFSSEVLDTDIYWIERDASIELEKNYYTIKVREKEKKFSKIFNDVFIFNLNEIPDNIFKMMDYFKERLGV